MKNLLGFSKNFLWGSAVSEYQVSGALYCPHSQWAQWEKKKGAIREGDRSGASADHAFRFEEDITLMQELGLNSFRFSIEWSSVEPVEGQFNRQILAEYRNRIKALVARGITPMVTLHHFTHPTWFEEKGGFTKAENIAFFVRFARRIFLEYSAYVSLWCTINEPSIVSLMGYFMGAFPPGTKDLTTAGVVLKNMLWAHVQVYEILKAMPRGEESQIGLVHQYLRFEPYSKWNPFSSIICRYLTKNFHESILTFLRTGFFKFTIPFKGSLSFSLPSAKGSYDFLGINYYSRALLKMQWSLKEPLQAACYPDEVMTDMPYAVYPRGFYEALVDCSSLGKPIYVTENGIADERDDRREGFIRGYLEALSDAMKKGVDVRGYFYWSLLDNFEWAEGWKMRFGLYSFDPITKKRTLKKGSQIYRQIIEEARGSTQDLTSHKMM